MSLNNKISDLTWLDELLTKCDIVLVHKGDSTFVLTPRELYAELHRPKRLTPSHWFDFDTWHVESIWRHLEVYNQQIMKLMQAQAAFMKRLR